MQRTFRNTTKYLKKNVEYYLDFTVDHLIKLEPGFNTEVSIYDDNGNNYIISPNKPTVKLVGNNFRIKSNDDALVYFYGKKVPGYQQPRIDPNKIGKNLEIKSKNYVMYVIDFGFVDYNPLDVLSLTFYSLDKGGNIYIENIYDKLQTKLVEGEYLYLYYISNEILNVTKYTTNINHKNNEYTFNMIPKNIVNEEEEKTLIINVGNKNLIRYQVNFCESPHKIKIYYQNTESLNEDLIEFNNTTLIDQNITKYRPIKLRFESDKDFVFSYSFIDRSDSAIKECEKWNKQRKVLTNLTIENVTKKYPDDNTSDIFSIKFLPNYKKSSTRYIIVVTSNDENNSIDNLSNPCYVTKLATEKPKGIKTINVVDIGEKDSIEIDIDISDILGKTDKYILNIISQEIRFDKKINYYTPITFIHRANEERDNENDKNNKNSESDEGFPLIYIICISVFGFIILIIILFLIIRCYKKKNQKQEVDYNQTDKIPNEQLLNDM